MLPYYHQKTSNTENRNEASSNNPNHARPSDLGDRDSNSNLRDRDNRGNTFNLRDQTTSNKPNHAHTSQTGFSITNSNPSHPGDDRGDNLNLRHLGNSRASNSNLRDKVMKIKPDPDVQYQPLPMLRDFYSQKGENLLSCLSF